MPQPPPVSSAPGEAGGAADPVVRVEQAARVFRRHGVEVPALRGVDLVVQRGEFLAVTGPSGSGKSTLLHLLAGLDLPTSGRVLVDGIDLATLDDDARTLFRRRRLGFVLQFANLLPTLTVEENVALPLLMDGRRPGAAAAQARVLLEQVGVAHRARALPDELSGGETQRATVARALICEPALLLADEPTGALDSESGAVVLELLRSAVDAGRTLVMVTHEPRAAASADRVVRIEDGLLVPSPVLAPQ